MKILKNKWFLRVVIIVILSIVGYVLLAHDTATFPEFVARYRAEKLEEKSVEQEAEAESGVGEEEEKNSSETVMPLEKINLNTADAKTLETLPGIGRTLAERILSYREKTPFKVIRDLKKIEGIGDKTFQKLSELICVE